MRLLNVETFKLESYYEPKVPPYAALSHTWGPDDREISFQDITNGFDKSQKDWEKVSQAAAVAKGYSHDYIWIDTCCIDKSSSAELSEAINSMYRWYSNCSVCLVYLVDVKDTLPLNLSKYIVFREDPRSKSRWFTRGWTLQELIAPQEVMFYNSKWELIGDKRTLAGKMAIITDIDEEVLRDNTKLHSKSIAQKMSWASARNTKRLEDIAYCLMGIFDVNMPLLYGEGHRAFVRLQEEIMQRSCDQSLFTWKNLDASRSSNIVKASKENKPVGIGILAPHPACFSTCGDIVSYSMDTGEEPYSMTNRGLRIDMRILTLPNVLEVLAFPRCRRRNELHTALAVPLALATRSTALSGPGYYRIAKKDLCDVAYDDIKQARTTAIYVHSAGPFWRPIERNMSYHCKFRLSNKVLLAALRYCEYPFKQNTSCQEQHAFCEISWPKSWTGMRAIICSDRGKGPVFMVSVTLLHNGWGPEKSIRMCAMHLELNVLKESHDIISEMETQLQNDSNVRKKDGLKCAANSMSVRTGVLTSSGLVVQTNVERVHDEEILVLDFLAP